MTKRCNITPAQRLPRSSSTRLNYQPNAPLVQIDKKTQQLVIGKPLSKGRRQYRTCADLRFVRLRMIPYPSTE